MSEQAPQRTRLAAVLRFVDVATDALADAREEIDALNVYPVPDGDTGTNMFLTVSAARDGIREATGGDPAADLGAAMSALGRSALLGARGNSGVILAQMLGAVASRLAHPPGDERGATLLAEAIRDAAEASYAAVAEPVEGTILSVARGAADAALATLAEEQSRSRDVLAAAAAGAREALARTPTQLDRLARAGVVDAGGRGLSVVLDAAETALTGRTPVAAPAAVGEHRIPVPLPSGDLTAEGPAYEVMYLLDAPDDAVGTLRTTLAGLGDSLVVVGGEGLWHVHVHVDDVGAALEAGIEAGRPHRVRVTHFAEQAAGREEPVRAPRGRGVVAVAAGPGLARLFTDAGATVVDAPPGHRASTGELLQAIRDCGGEEVVVLPNDPDTVRTAEVAARTAEESGELRVAVIPTHAQVQGVAAVAVHEPGRGFEADVREMTATARHARHGAVTVAARQAITMAGPCEVGDALGVIEGDFAVVGSRLDEVAGQVAERLLGGGGELVTVVSGAAAGAGELAAGLAAHLEREHPSVDVVVHEGGQERYPLLLAVE